MRADALDRIAIRRFKSFHYVDLALRPINILIGPNGSGKSNLIQVFSLVQEQLSGRLSEYVATAGGAERLLHFGKRASKSLAVQLSFKNGRRFVSLLLATEQDDLRPADESVHLPDDATMLGEEFEGEETLVASKERMLDLVVSWGVYHFHDTSSTSSLRRTADVNDNRALRRDGANLASYLYLLKSRHPAEYEQIQSTLRLVAPFFDSFVLEPLRLNPSAIRLEWRHKGTDDFFDVSAFSDGTLRFIALATLLLQPAEFRPTIAILDEPELGLHPDAIALLASMIKQATTTTQIIAATQSPILLDHFEPEDIVVASRENGATTLKRLEPGPLRIWLEEYSLGQLWEKNEIGGNPVSE